MVYSPSCLTTNKLWMLNILYNWFICISSFISGVQLQRSKMLGKLYRRDFLNIYYSKKIIIMERNIYLYKAENCGRVVDSNYRHSQT